MANVVITSRPITGSEDAFLLLENEHRSLEKYMLKQNDQIFINIVKPEEKRCIGWYDIATHTNHVCDASQNVGAKYESCFGCRQNTGFNPAFYNTPDISDVQEEYNSKAHSVYIAYFGGGLAKAGIMSDSRGLARLYEQGALLYHLVGSFENAATAHEEEKTLIQAGLKNSITKRQKAKILEKPFDLEYEQKCFSKILHTVHISNAGIVSNVDHFFFGHYPHQEIQPIGNNPISGIIKGIIGRYLILENNDRLYGYWLSELSGYCVNIKKVLEEIESTPTQASLFD